MTAFIEVAVNVPQVDGTYTYHLPPELEGQVQPGSLVIVPFGKQEVQGVALRLSPGEQVFETRAALALLDRAPVLTGWQLRLAEWLARETLAPLAVCATLMLPPGLAQQADTLYHLNPPAIPTGADLAPIQKRLIDLLARRGDLRGRQIDDAFPRVAWRPAAQTMARRGWLTAAPTLPPPTVRPRVVRTVQLACSPETAEEHMPRLGRAGSAALARRQAMLRFLIHEPWPIDVSWAYAAAGGASLADLHALAEDGLVLLSESEVWRDPLARIEQPGPSAPPTLTGEQQHAWDALRGALQAAARDPQNEVSPHLLYGITGSGKTELYLRAIEETLRLGRQAIFLVPEISLTPQTVRRVTARFPGQVGLVHSRLSPGERFDTWRRARAGLLPVIVGPRSALFTPLPDPGLVVIDECHDGSYFQDDFPPAYSAIEAALALAHFNHGVALLGSATPGAAVVERARRKNWPVLRLAQRASGQPLPPVEVVDMRAELKSGNRDIFSRALLNALEDTLKAGKQAILFLNRRGAASYVFCRACGLSLKCPRCDLPLTWHNQQTALICHTCGYQRKMPTRCPACGSDQIRQFGLGTEKVESSVAERFPEARVVRMDADTTREKNAHEILLAHFARHSADVLVGTQMIAKGLDLPDVTLVGMVLADVGLNLPDYRAAERTFELLTQVAGRAGRGASGGRAILQTFTPDHYAIRCAAGHDTAAFYDQEMESRRRLHYPPFYRLARLEYRHDSAERAEAAAQDLARRLDGWLEAAGNPAIERVGPTPCFFAKINGVYRWQILLRGANPAAFLRGRSLGPGWRVTIDPMELL